MKATSIPLSYNHTDSQVSYTFAPAQQSNRRVNNETRCGKKSKTLVGLCQAAPFRKAEGGRLRLRSRLSKDLTFLFFANPFLLARNYVSLLILMCAYIFKRNC